MPWKPGLLLTWLIPCVCLAQNTQKPTTPDTFQNEAFVIERSETTYRMHGDGTGERDLHVVIRIQSQGAAQQFGVLAFSFASASETPHIKLVRVHKTDGTTVETPADNAIDMPAAVTREAPLYSDLKEKHLPVRSLSAGDTLEYEVDTQIEKPEAPGQFWGAAHFTVPGTVIVLAEVLTLEVPREKYVQVWSPNHKATVTEKNGLRTYVWQQAQLVTAPKKTDDDDAPKQEAPKDPDEDEDGRKLPSVAWTTFHNWTEVGDWYRSLARDRAKPNDALRARADELTSKSKSPEEQIRAIYDYVSGQNRYVGIDFGIGRYQPHAAAEVMANQYGDCKDKDTLLEALLQAKGFSTAPALIGAGIAPVPDVPSPAVFNHVITTVKLPDGRIWLDSTPAAAPFRYLSAVIRDQKALVIPADGPATLESTPANPPYPLTSKFEAVGTLDAEGKLTAKMTATYHDDDEVAIRILARSAAPAERDKVSQYFSAYSGFGGTTSNTAFSNEADSTQPVQMKYDYARHPYGDWDSLRILPLFPSVGFTSLSSKTNAPDDDIQLGAPRTMTARSAIRLPEGFRTDLPDPIHVKTDFATFDLTYRFDNGEIVSERTVVVLKKKVAKADWKKYQEFTKNINLDNLTWIQLIRGPKSIAIAKSDKPETKGTETKPGPEKVQAQSVTALMAQAMQSVQDREWEHARELLQQVEQKDSKARGLWAERGFIAEISDHNLEEAKADYRKELANEPDNVWTVNALSRLEANTGHGGEARKLIQEYVQAHPENLEMALSLAFLQTNAGDDNGALKTLETASAQHPDNRLLSLQMGGVLIRLNRKQEAAAVARSAMDGTDDPAILNDAAYVLSESGIDLASAEEASRKSIAKLEEESASMTTAQANSKAFARANLMVAAWDTLGWTLFQEGKHDEAEPILSAAWRASLRPEIGDHLAQLYEAAGQKQRAYELYVLAQAAFDRSTPPDVKTRVAESATRLRPADAKAPRWLNSEGLQSLRTYKIDKPAGVSGWGTFRLEISTAGVIESQQMSGDHKIEPVKPAIAAMKFPELLPPGSKAHLLRSAVVSCASGSKCEVVLVPDGGLQTEQQQ